MDERTAHNRAEYDLLAPAYDRRYPAARPGLLQELLDALLARLGPHPRVLDLGCGPGRDVADLAARGASPVGVDLSAGMLALAAGRAPGRLMQADVRALPLADASVDGVWSCYALLHLDASGLAVALAEAVRVLRPGGGLAVVLASGGGTTLEPVTYAPDRTRWFVGHDLDEVAALAAGLGLEVALLDVVPEAHRSPLRLVAVRP